MPAKKARPRKTVAKAKKEAEVSEEAVVDEEVLDPPSPGPDTTEEAEGRPAEPSSGPAEDLPRGPFPHRVEPFRAAAGEDAGWGYRVCNNAGGVLTESEASFANPKEAVRAGSKDPQAAGATLPFRV